jgi:uncharacterized protein (DUF433 family)
MIMSGERKFAVAASHVETRISVVLLAEARAITRIFSPSPEAELAWQDRISSSPNVCHGKVCIAGTRIPVSVILENLAENVSEADLLTSYPSLRTEDINAALKYAAELAAGRVIPLPEAA